MKKGLGKILGAFEKTAKELETYLTQNTQEQQSCEAIIRNTEIRKENLVAENNRASNALTKIKEIVGE